MFFFVNFNFFVNTFFAPMSEIFSDSDSVESGDFNGTNFIKIEKTNLLSTGEFQKNISLNNSK